MSKFVEQPAKAVMMSAQTVAMPAQGERGASRKMGRRGAGARQAVVAAVATALLVAGCAGMDDTQRRTAIGTGIGAAVGAALGGNTSGAKGVRNGALIGGAIAGVGTYIWSRQMEEQKRAMEEATAGTGVQVSRIMIDGRGSRDPIADNNTQAGRAQNRRVEIYVGQAANPQQQQQGNGQYQNNGNGQYNQNGGQYNNGYQHGQRSTLQQGGQRNSYRSGSGQWSQDGTYNGNDGYSSTIQ